MQSTSKHRPNVGSTPVLRKTVRDRKRFIADARKTHSLALDQDRRHLWHPFTAMDQWLQMDPTCIVAGHGFQLEDSTGRRYLDGFSSLWCNLFGHRVPAIDQAIRTQLKRIAHSTQLGLTNDLTAALAARLCRLAPAGLSRVFFADSGSEAVEVALKMAYQYWAMQPNPAAKRRNLFLRLGEAYHGDTLGSVSVGGIDLFHKTYRKLVFPTVELPTPYVLHRPAGMRPAEYIRRWRKQATALFERVGEQLAAVVMEPCVQGAAGMILHPPGTAAFLRRLATQHGTLMICDEVATGFCRTGRLFAVEHENVRPDFLCIAKGLTGGYLPVSATLTTEKIFQRFTAAGEVFYHGHTYGGNPLGCAAALATLDLIEKRRLTAHVRKMSLVFRQALAPLENHPNVAEIRLLGLMGGIELVRDRHTLQLFEANERIPARICMAARQRGVMLRPLGNTIPLMPIPAMGPRELRQIGRVLCAAVREVLG